MPDATPLEIFRRKQIDATDRSSAQWSKVPAAHRTNALFSAHVEKAALLQRMQTLLDDYLAGARESVTLPDGTQTTVGKVQGKADFINQMREFMINEGMDPDAKNNKITNIGARSRLSLIFDTQVRAAYGQARWEQGMAEDMLKAYPAWRFVRNPGARVKRELHVRNEGAVRLKTDYQFWAQEMNAADIGGFTVPWPPFGFNSYMDLESVSAAECEQLGIKVPKAQSLKQDAHANQKFGSRAPERANRAKASTKSIKDPDLLAQLKAELKALVGEDAVDEKGQLKVSNAQLGKIIEQKNAAKSNPKPQAKPKPAPKATPSPKPAPAPTQPKSTPKPTSATPALTPTPAQMPALKKKPKAVTKAAPQQAPPAKAAPPSAQPSASIQAPQTATTNTHYHSYGKKDGDLLLRPITGKAWLNATNEQKYAAYAYTGSSYDEINGILRAGIPPVTAAEKAAMDRADRITELIDNTDPIPEDIMVYRGTNSFPELEQALGLTNGMPTIDQALVNRLNKKAIGKKITEPSFLSTAVEKGAGFSYKDIYIYIRVPKGSKGIYTEPFSAHGKGHKFAWDGIATQKNISNEDEIIFQRGSTLRFLGFALKKNQLIIEAELIQ